MAESTHTIPASAPWPKPAYSWYVVAVLMVAYMLSLMDRVLLGFLIEPVRMDLGLSDTQIGLLLGFGFVMFYSVLGVPLGALADRSNRRNLIVAGLVVWTLATAGTGFAGGFAAILFARTMVGAGEAALSPCAVSTIGDSFPRHKVGFALSIYSIGGAVGIGVATADLFPRFTLSGLLGSIAADSSDLFSGPAESRRVALGIDWTFLDHGKVKARIDAADADSRAALADYQQAVLSALEDTETRLVRYQHSRQRAERLQQAADDAERAAELALTRYERGFIGYFEVLAGEQELRATRDASVRSRTNVTLALVEVYRALAGAPPSAR